MNFPILPEKEYHEAISFAAQESGVTVQELEEFLTATMSEFIEAATAEDRQGFQEIFGGPPTVNQFLSFMAHASKYHDPRPPFDMLTI